MEPEGTAADTIASGDDGQSSSDISSPSLLLRHVYSIQQQLSRLTAEVQRISNKQNQISEEVRVFHDRIDNLEHCNQDHFQQLQVTENAVDIALQRIRLTEESIRNIQRTNAGTRFQILEATCEHLAVRVNRLATRIAELERLLNLYRIS